MRKTLVERSKSPREIEGHSYITSNHLTTCYEPADVRHLSRSINHPAHPGGMWVIWSTVIMKLTSIRHQNIPGWYSSGRQDSPEVLRYEKRAFEHFPMIIKYIMLKFLDYFFRKCRFFLSPYGFCLWANLLEKTIFFSLRDYVRGRNRYYRVQWKNSYQTRPFSASSRW